MPQKWTFIHEETERAIAEGRVRIFRERSTPVTEDDIAESDPTHIATPEMLAKCDKALKPGMVRHHRLESDLPRLIVLVDITETDEEDIFSAVVRIRYGA